MVRRTHWLDSVLMKSSLVGLLILCAMQIDTKEGIEVSQRSTTKPI
jgi:hypothetical protein